MPDALLLSLENRYANTWPELVSRVTPSPLKEPRLVHANLQVAALLGLDSPDPDALTRHFSGHEPLPGSDPVAMTYSGHQFGVYNPQLGDGRGMLLGEVRDADGCYWDLHLKGAGKTPYSRFGDGRAVLRSTIREYLCGEAMHGLGIPTTRALCIIGSREPVQRETLEHGATLLRVADSHIRFGHFEWLFHNRSDLLPRFADYVIDRHFPECRDTPAPVHAFLREVVHRTARLMADWQRVGFAHGVMNTDNFSITGATFDYGPYGFLEAYEPGYICNHSDHSGRYAWNQQPSIGLWNLNALAYALSPLIERDAIIAALQEYEPALLAHYDAGMRRKLGLVETYPDDSALLMDFLSLLMRQGADYTRSFRALCTVNQNDTRHPLRDDFLDREAFDAWLARYTARLKQEGRPDEERQAVMRQANPKFILRNYLAHIAIQKAEKGDTSEIDRLMALLQEPFDEWPQYASYAGLPPDWGRKMEISCSS